jgi:hypothetical protein
MPEDKIYETQPVLELSVARRPGRKRKLTPVVFEKIMGRIEDGERLYSACAANGVSQKTLLGLVNQDHQAAKRYATAKTIRLQRWHEQWLGEMCQHSEHSPWATGWLLERNFPSMYAMKDVVRPEPPAETGQGATQLMVLTVTDHDFAELEKEPGYTAITDGGLEMINAGLKIQVFRMDANQRLLN